MKTFKATGFRNMKSTINDLIAVGNKIIKFKAEINRIEDKILLCNACEKVTPIKDSATYYRKKAKELKDSLPQQRRQIFIFEMGYNVLLNKN